MRASLVKRFFANGCVGIRLDVELRGAFCWHTPRAKNLRLGRPGRRRPRLHKRVGSYMHILGAARTLWVGTMTLVTLSLRYEEPTIGLG